MPICRHGLALKVSSMADSECDCPGCEISDDPNQGYQPCHNGGEKGSPPKEH